MVKKSENNTDKASISHQNRDLEEVEKLLKQKEQQRIKRKAKDKAPKTPYKYLIAVDFEATCFDKPYNRNIQEIIEFPAVLIDLETGVILSEFQRYVRPVEIPILSDYCTELTGISQETVDKGELLEDVMEQFISWMKEIIARYDLILPKTKKSNLLGNCIICTWGNWDFLIQLKAECSRKKIRRPPFLNQWCDLKEVYTDKNAFKAKFSFGDALLHSNLPFEGRPHSGLDDARMTAKLAAKMRNEGLNIRITKDLNRAFLNRAF